jgi:hypothetical protein
MLTRRRFAFWFGFGLFSLADKLRLYALDDIAAATMGAADPTPPAKPATPTTPVHWTSVSDRKWR